MKNKSLLLFALIINTSISGMKHHLEIQPAATTLTMLPDDCLRHLCSYIAPTWNNWKINSKNLLTSINAIEPLTTISKDFNVTFLLTRVASLLQVDDVNKNLFLLRSAQAGIPCFVQYTITHGANVNYNKKNEFQPLTYAVMNKNYKCAQLLLNANASTEQSTEYFPVYFQPIQLATGAGDLRMVTLLLDFHADPNTSTPLQCDPTIFRNTLEIALNGRHISIAQLLIKKGAIVYERDRLKLQELLATRRPKQKNTTK